MPKLKLPWKMKRESCNMSKYCKIILRDGQAVSLDGATHEKLSTEEQIQEDKKYGTLKPRNRKYFTYKEGEQAIPRVFPIFPGSPIPSRAPTDNQL